MSIPTFLIHLPRARVHLLSELRRWGLDVNFFTTGGMLDEGLYEQIAPGVSHVTNAHALSGRSTVLEPSSPARIEDIERLAPTETAALLCFDRSNSLRRSVQDLHAIYLEHIGRWRQVLGRYDPEVVIFTDIPHHGWDNILYELCRADGRQIVIIGPTYLDRRIVLKTSIEDIPGPSSGEIDAVAAGPSPPDVPRCAWSLKENKRLNNARRLRSMVSLRGAVRLLVGLRQFSRSRPRPLFYGDETPRHIKIRWYLFRNRLHCRKLLRHYDSIAEEPDFGRDYVFFPLPMQPEMTTVPLAGHFSEQVNLIRTVAASLPVGWRLYVKEHPHQFAWGLAKVGRSVRHYELLREIPNVVLVRFEADSLQLARHSRAVATATGTAGWEGIQAGVPALVFGNPWYRCAPGAIAVRSFEECRDALIQIARGGLGPSPELVRAYTHLMATRYTIEAIFDPEAALHADGDLQATAARLAAGIHNLLEQRKIDDAGSPVLIERGTGLH